MFTPKRKLYGCDGAMVKDLILQCEGEEFKISNLQFRPLLWWPN
jgi:hypothetical protein